MSCCSPRDKETYALRIGLPLVKNHTGKNCAHYPPSYALSPNRDNCSDFFRQKYLWKQYDFWYFFRYESFSFRYRPADNYSLLQRNKIHRSNDHRLKYSLDISM